jgi:salicylate biosynthesis isochorismate synthase
MLAPLNLLEQLQARLDEWLGSIPAGELQAPGALASLILELPECPSLPPRIPDCPRFGFVHAARGELRAGYGIAAEWTATGSDRLEILGKAARELSGSWHRFDPDETGFSGFSLLGFAAHPDAPGVRAWHPESEQGELSTAPPDFPNALLWVPELALVSRRGQAALVLTTALPVERDSLHARWRDWIARLVPALGAPLPEPLTASGLTPLGSLPALGDWRALVESALAEIGRGPLDKVVLCRRVGLRGRRPFDLPRLLAALTYLFPSCQVLSIERGSSSFVAATPECLLRVSGSQVDVDAIAGTAARSASAAQDAALTQALRASEKDRREHTHVLDAVRGALEGCCTDVSVPERPTVMQLHNAQHLWSPVTARLGEGTDLFGLAERLHPTPATNGQPKREARDWLTLAEPLERGWYTGAAGILEPDLSGELWVLLRCAELSGDSARLYAGAGIVAGSDPLAEWRETGHKLAAIATALQFA